MAPVYTGTFDFTTHTLSVSNDIISGPGDRSLPGPVLCKLIGPSVQVFDPKAGSTFLTIIQNGVGGTTINSADLTAGNLTITSGALNLGTVSITAVASISGAGSIDFGIACTLFVNGATANFG